MGQMEGFEETIQVACQVIEGTPSAPPSLGVFLNVLSRRYERTGQAADLEETIQIARQVVKNTHARPRRIRLNV